MTNAFALLQAVQDSVVDSQTGGLSQRIIDFFDTPAPYSPFSEYLLILFILWLLARRDHRKQTFEKQAQEVLQEKFAAGEIDQKTFDTYRQDVSLRSRR